MRTAALRRARLRFADLNIELDGYRVGGFLNGQKGKLLDVIRRAIAPDNHLVSLPFDLELVDASPGALNNSAFEIFVPFRPRICSYVQVHDGHHNFPSWVVFL